MQCSLLRRSLFWLSGQFTATGYARACGDPMTSESLGASEDLGAAGDLGASDDLGALEDLVASGGFSEDFEEGEALVGFRKLSAVVIVLPCGSTVTKDHSVADQVVLVEARAPVTVTYFVFFLVWRWVLVLWRVLITVVQVSVKARGANEAVNGLGTGLLIAGRLKRELRVSGSGGETRAESGPRAVASGTTGPDMSGGRVRLPRSLSASDQVAVVVMVRMSVTMAVGWMVVVASIVLVEVLSIVLVCLKMLVLV